MRTRWPLVGAQTVSTTTFVNGVTLSDQGWFNDTDSNTYAYTSVAGTNTITATAPLGMAALSAGMVAKFIPANTNSGAATFNGKDVHQGGIALTGGELLQSVPALLYYDGTQFNLIGPFSGGQKGVWTPSDTSGGGLTFANVSATYTKIGNICHAQCRIDWPATADANNVTISGLPFTVANVDAARQGAVSFTTVATLARALTNKGAVTFNL